MSVEQPPPHSLCPCSNSSEGLAAEKTHAFKASRAKIFKRMAIIFGDVFRLSGWIECLCQTDAVRFEICL